MLHLMLLRAALADEPAIELSAPPITVDGGVPDYPVMMRRLRDEPTGYADCSVRVTISERGQAVDADVLDCPVPFQEELWDFVAAVRWEAPVVEGQARAARFVYRYRFEHPTHPADEPWSWQNIGTSDRCVSGIVIWTDGVVTPLSNDFPKGCELTPRPVLAPPIGALPRSSTSPVALQCTVSFSWSRRHESVDFLDPFEPYPCHAFSPMIADAVRAQIPREPELARQSPFIPHGRYDPPATSLARRQTILVFLDPRTSEQGGHGGPPHENEP